MKSIKDLINNEGTKARINKNQDKIKDSEILMFINNNVCQPFNTFLGQVRRRRRSMLKVMTRMMIRY